MSEQFVLATHNPAKLREMRDILSELGLEVISPEEAGVVVDVEETGTTFAENAMLKAKALCVQTGLPAIGDDSGLCVDVLNGGPGVYSARYGGESLSDAERNKLLLESVKGQGRRDAHFTCAIACAFPNGDTLTAEERCDGVISYIPLGTEGFGYDPIFNYPPKLKTFAQMTPEEKSEVSHRGKALRAFAETLGAYLSERAWNELEEEKQKLEAAESADAPESVETSELPDAPEAVGTSETPDAPESVETPQTPDTPESVETPELPDAPEAAETPELPDAPEAVGTPKLPDAPEAVGTPKLPDAPESVETSELPDAPEPVATSETPDAPETASRHHKKRKKRKKHH
ncbi:MAG: RdgB/HAM1 family non-canonical purine NTP pyrophosphatase [Oscillibacter sp.]|nr:RdgB/HAM1 family non-canonical purine NTP pyrophosphatase [Oscillibacter sp.]